MISNMAEMLGQESLILIVEFAIFCAIFTIGIFLQVKVIVALKRDQPQAWEMKLADSVVQIVHWSLKMFLGCIYYIQPTFFDFFGAWFRYFLLFVMWFGSFEMLFHSLYISVHKYFFIVHHETVNLIGERKIKGRLLLVYLIILISWTLSYTARAPSSAFPIISKVSPSHASATDDISSIEEPIENPTSHTFTCGINDPDQKFMENVLVNIVTKLLCSSQNIITFVIALNMLEIFFYFSIFRYMNR